MDDISYSFEDWEEISDLYDEEDYPLLLQYCEKNYKESPDDPYSQYRLGEAYFLNGDYEKAIQFMKSCLLNFPENLDFQYVVIDALFALGKNENDFEWIQKPEVLRLDQEINDFFYNFLKAKRKPWTIIDLYGELIMKGYLLFNEKDLFHALVVDDRFIVKNSGSEASAEIVVNRKNK